MKITEMINEYGLPDEQYQRIVTFKDDNNG